MQGKRTEPAALLSTLTAVGTDPQTTATAISRVVGVPLHTVTDLFAKYQPVADELRTFKRDWIGGMWQSALGGALGQLHELAYTAGGLRAKDAKDWATVAGIATDKLLILNGMPTQIVGNLHNVRHELGPLAARLLEVTKAIGPARVIEGERG